MTFDFDATKVDPESRYDPLPAGWYTCRIASVDLAKTGAGDPMLKLCFEVDAAAESGAGRKVWWNLCVGHGKDQVRAIAQRQLSAVCHAVGVLKLTEDNLFDLCGHLIDVKVTVRHDETHGDSNDVKGVREHVPGRARNDAAKPKLDFVARDPKAKRPAAAAPGTNNGPDYGDIPF